MDATLPGRDAGGKSGLSILSPPACWTQSSEVCLLPLLAELALLRCRYPGRALTSGRAKERRFYISKPLKCPEIESKTKSMRECGKNERT